MDRFTETARHARVRSRQLRGELRSAQLDVEHLMVALVEQPESLVVQILDHVGVDGRQIGQRLREMLESGPRTYQSVGQQMQVYVAPRLKRVFDQATAEAERLKDEYIGTEHLLIAI